MNTTFEDIKKWQPRPVETAPPNLTGKLRGYCTDCGHMMVNGEEVCTRCLSEGGVTQNAPQGVEVASRVAMLMV